MLCSFLLYNEVNQLYVYLLLLLSHFSCVRLCATPQTAAHQAPPSLGFSRQEHWSGLPFPSPMHESEKWKWSLSVVSDSSQLRGLQPTSLLCLWDFPGKSTGVGCILVEFNWIDYCSKGFPGGASGKERVCQWGRQNRPGFNPWVRKIPPGGGHGNPLQFSCLENPGNSGAWRAAVHRVAKSLN